MVEKSEMRKIPQEQKRKHFSKKNEHELKANQNRFLKFFSNSICYHMVQ